MKKYEENKDHLLRQGITSFSGYITKFLFNALEQEKREKKQSTKKNRAKTGS